MRYFPQKLTFFLSVTDFFKIGAQLPRLDLIEYIVGIFANTVNFFYNLEIASYIFKQLKYIFKLKWRKGLFLFNNKEIAYR